MFEDYAAVRELEEKIIPWQTPKDEPSPERLRKAYAPGALAAAESFLRRSSRPGAARPGRDEANANEARRQYERLLRWARLCGRLIDPLLLRHLDNIGGVEHETFHEPLSGRWVKLTLPGKAGKELHAHQEQPGLRPTLMTEDALPASYLRRLRLANDKLGDDFCLHGVIESAAGARLVVSQRHVRGESATPEEVAGHFRAAGFRQINAKTFYHDRANLLVSDAHCANVFKTPEGVAVPFDVAVQQPMGNLRQAVELPPALDFDGESQQPLDF